MDLLCVIVTFGKPFVSHICTCTYLMNIFLYYERIICHRHTFHNDKDLQNMRLAVWVEEKVRMIDRMAALVGELVFHLLSWVRPLAVSWHCG